MPNILAGTISENGRPILKALSDVSGSKKSNFRPGLSVRGGKLDIHSPIGKLRRPKSGWTRPGYRYMGPYNSLDKQQECHPATGKVLSGM